MRVCECVVDVFRNETNEHGNWRLGGREGPVVEGLGPLESTDSAEFSERGRGSF